MTHTYLIVLSTKSAYIFLPLVLMIFSVLPVDASSFNGTYEDESNDVSFRKRDSEGHIDADPSDVVLDDFKSIDLVTGGLLYDEETREITSIFTTGGNILSQIHEINSTINYVQYVISLDFTYNCFINGCEKDDSIALQFTLNHTQVYASAIFHKARYLDGETMILDLLYSVQNNTLILKTTIETVRAIDIMEGKMEGYYDYAFATYIDYSDTTPYFGFASDVLYHRFSQPKKVSFSFSVNSIGLNQLTLYIGLIVLLRSMIYSHRHYRRHSR